MTANLFSAISHNIVPDTAIVSIVLIGGAAGGVMCTAAVLLIMIVTIVDIR